MVHVGELFERPSFVAKLFERLQKAVRELRVELASTAATDFGDCDVVVERFPIGAVARHRVIGVRDGDDARDQWHVIPLQSERVAEAVPALVVQVHARNERMEKLDRLQDVAAVLRMLFEGLVFLLRELAGLVDWRTTSMSASQRPSLIAKICAYAATRAECPAVYRSILSIALASPRIVCLNVACRSS